MPRYNQKSITVSISLKNKIRDYMKEYGFHSQPQAIESALGDLARRNLSADQASTPGFGIALGALLAPLAIASLVVARGLLKGRRWAWNAALVLSIISMASYAFTVAIIPRNGGRMLGVITGAVIIYCLYRPHVKAYFGRGWHMHNV